MALNWGQGQPCRGHSNQVLALCYKVTELLGWWQAPGRVTAHGSFTVLRLPEASAGSAVCTYAREERPGQGGRRAARSRARLLSHQRALRGRSREIKRKNCSWRYF